MKNQLFFRRLSFALNGLITAIKGEASFRQQLVAAVLALLSLAVFGASPVWWAIFILIIGAILAMELFNTALEHLLDRLHPEIHPSVQLAKDCAAGAVLILSLCSVLIFVCFVVAELF